MERKSLALSFWPLHRVSLLLALAAMLLMQSCSKDIKEAPQPTVAKSANSTTGYAIALNVYKIQGPTAGYTEITVGTQLELSWPDASYRPIQPTMQARLELYDSNGKLLIVAPHIALFSNFGYNGRQPNGTYFTLPPYLNPGNYSVKIFAEGSQGLTHSNSGDPIVTEADGKFTIAQNSNVRVAGYNSGIYDYGTNPPQNSYPSSLPVFWYASLLNPAGNPANNPSSSSAPLRVAMLNRSTDVTYILTEELGYKSRNSFLSSDDHGTISFLDPNTNISDLPAGYYTPYIDDYYTRYVSTYGSVLVQ